MSTIDLKEQLISQIHITEDHEILEWMLGLLAQQANQTELYDLNIEQINAINRAEEQIIRGEYYSEEEANKLTIEWLKR
jgi:hypothetical protein